MQIPEIEQQIIEEFNAFSDWTEKYEYIIQLGKTLPLIDEAHKTPQHIITGCQSQVWLHAEYSNGTVIYKADSDAIITKGIIALLIKVLSSQPPAAIITAKMDFINHIGLKEHLSPTRSNGLLSMIKQMKLYALAFQAKHEQKG